MRNASAGSTSRVNATRMTATSTSSRRARTAEGEVTSRGSIAGRSYVLAHTRDGLAATQASSSSSGRVLSTLRGSTHARRAWSTPQRT